MTKTVLITGASSGFGDLAVKKFQKEGWNVVATMRSPEKDMTLKFLDRVLVTRLDVTDKDSINAAVAETIEKFGSLDVLVNNAGFGVAGFLEEASEEEVDQQLNTNLRGVIWTSQAVIEQMRKQKSGVIINVTSLAGSVGMPMLSLYNATKFGVEGLTESMRYELEPFGIRALTIAPGAFKTGFGNASIWTDGNSKDTLNNMREKFKIHYSSMLASPPKPFGFGNPQEVADLIYKSAIKKMPHRNYVGKDAKMITRIRKIMPERNMYNMLKNSILPQNW